MSYLKNDRYPSFQETLTAALWYSSTASDQLLTESQIGIQSTGCLLQGPWGNLDPTGETSGWNQNLENKDASPAQNGGLIQHCPANRCSGCKFQSCHFFPLPPSAISGHYVLKHSLCSKKKKSISQPFLKVWKQFLSRVLNPITLFFLHHILSLLFSPSIQNG